MNLKTNEEKKMTRRAFIMKSGAAFFVISAAGLTWRAIDQGVFRTGKGPAYEPWDISNDNVQKGTLALVNDAILASNPHNTQPWLFKVTDTFIEIYADESRNIGAIDPLRREMFIGLGCAIENLMISAGVHGYQPRLLYKPNRLEPLCIARIDLEQSSEYDSRYIRPFLLDIHTVENMILERPISKTIFTEVENILVDEENVRLSWFSSTEEKQMIGDLIVKATEAIINDEEMSTATNNWYNGNWKDIQKERDGVTLDAQGGSFLIRAIGKLLPPLSHEKNNQFWLSSTKDIHTATAAAYGLISVKDSSDNEQRARAGRAWQRIHLYGTNLGLGLHPLNQLNEMADREKSLNVTGHFGGELKKITGDPSWNGLFIFRIGYPLKETNLSPRRSINEVIL